MKTAANRRGMRIEGIASTETRLITNLAAAARSARLVESRVATEAPHIYRSARLPVRLGHYAITGKLGEAVWASSNAARDERLGRTVALNDETARKRFWREARAAASVSQPNICQIYEIGQDAGELFIAMEVLDGQSLADERNARGPTLHGTRARHRRERRRPKRSLCCGSHPLRDARVPGRHSRAARSPRSSTRSSTGSRRRSAGRQQWRRLVLFTSYISARAVSARS
jgi:hypothetical protein